MAEPHARTETFTLHVGTVVLTFSREDGALVALALADGTSFAARTSPMPTVDVCLGERGWLSERTFSRYLWHHATDTTIEVASGLGSLRVIDRYTITGTLITRQLTLENVGDDEQRVLGTRFGIAGLHLGGRISGIFDAPGNSVRPRVPLAIAAAQRRDVLPRRFFAPGLRDGRAFEPAPVVGEGLLAIHSDDEHAALLCWYESPTDTVWPQLAGDDATLLFEHEVAASGWLRRGEQRTLGTQYMLLLRERWPQVLAAYRDTRALLGRTPALAAPVWLADAALYEAHPDQYGGVAGLIQALPALAALGITALCLPAVWTRNVPALPDSDDTWLDGQLHELHGLFALDPTETARIQSLVAAAHAAGLRVVLDLPLLGAAADAALVADKPAWFCHDIDGRPALRGDGAAIVPFDLGNTDLQTAIIARARHWLETLGHDGYRLIPPRDAVVNWHAPKHASLAGTSQVAQLLLATLAAIGGDLALITDAGGAHVAQHSHATVDELAHHQFVHAALGRLSPAELGTWLDDAQQLDATARARICFTESRRTRSANPLAAGLRGSRLSRMLISGLVFCGYIPLFWHEQEHSESELITRLLGARTASRALRYGSARYDAVESSNPQVFTVVRQTDDELLVGLLHMSAHHRHTSMRIAPALLAGGAYCARDILGEPPWRVDREQPRPVHNGQLDVELEPFGAYLLQLVRCNDEARSV